MASNSLETPLISSSPSPDSSPHHPMNGHTNGHTPAIHTNGLTNGHGSYGGAADASHKFDVPSSLSSKAQDDDTDLLYPSASTATVTAVHQLRLMVAALAITIVVLCIIFYVLLSNASSSSSFPSPACNHTQATGSQGMVSTTHYLATQAGLDMLKAGGNAFDAAAAIQFALNVVQPQSTGIGGGCFVVFYHAATKEVYSLDGREEAPAGFTEDAFCVNKTTCGVRASGETNYCGCLRNGGYPFRDRSTGGHPVGVPGVVAAMDRLLADYGTKTFAEALQPAIALADNGFPMYWEMHSRLELNADRMLQWPGNERLFFPNHSHPIAVGQTFTNPDLAKTFRDLAANGASYFYRGRLADEVIGTAHVALNPNTRAESALTNEDFERYKAVYREPVLSEYRQWAMVGMAGPSSGGLSMAMMLNVLESFQMNELRPQGGEWESRLIDAQDLVWADRALYMGDRDWVDVPDFRLLNKDYARARAAQFMHPLGAARTAQPGGALPYGNPYAFASQRAEALMEDGLVEGVTAEESNPFAEKYAPAPDSDKKGTTHLVVVDRWGNVVSMTTTIEENFGSGVLVPGRGFLLNNELTDFTPTPADATGRLYANRPQGGVRQRRTALGADAYSYGGKRPMSSMSPTIMLNGTTRQPVLAMGSPGGSTIIGTVLNGVINVVDGGMCVADAIAAPRMISQNAASQAEAGWYGAHYEKDRDVVAERGYTVTQLVTDRPLGFLEGVAIKGKNQYEGAGDYTRLSVASAAGY